MFIQSLQWYPTCSNAGCGLPLQKFESVQVAFRSIEILEFSLSWPSRGSRAWFDSTRSRHCGESPAMLPRAQTACAPIRQSVSFPFVTSKLDMPPIYGLHNLRRLSLQCRMSWQLIYSALERYGVGASKSLRVCPLTESVLLALAAWSEQQVPAPEHHRLAMPGAAQRWGRLHSRSPFECDLRCRTPHLSRPRLPQTAKAGNFVNELHVPRSRASNGEWFCRSMPAAAESPSAAEIVQSEG